MRMKEEFVTIRNYTTIFEFESKFDHVPAHQWMEENWTATFSYSAIYILVIFAGQQWMQNRARFELRGLLALWNFMLAAFSIIGSYRTIPEILYILNRENGFHNSVCLPSREHNSVWAFWALIFVLSKVVELGDTVFIVLRKQPLIFLHWYHHSTALIYSWYSYAGYVGPARWYITVNFLNHSFMYSYYGLKALRYHIPKPIAVTITSLQLVQMVVGVTVNVHAYQVKRSGTECDVSDVNVAVCLLMYGSYFFLFAHFFYKAYFTKRSAHSKRD